MQLDVFKNLEQYTKRNRNRTVWKKIVQFLACCVVFCTTYALILPAITMEQPTFCEYEEHVHDESCYIQHDVSTNLICSLESFGVHKHTEACFDVFGINICGYEARIAHTHTEQCYDADANLICTMLETVWHVHDETCLAPAGAVLICNTLEGDIHTHSDACYVSEFVNTDVLICTNIDIDHVHGDGCYAVEEVRTLICPVTEGEVHFHVNSCYDLQEGKTILSCSCSSLGIHVHNEACFNELGEIICGLADYPAHVHDATYCFDSEGNLVCPLEEVIVSHNHDESCVAAAEQPLTCVLEENEEHTHNFLCYGTWELVCEEEEHAHVLACFSDPEADLETSEDWESALANVSLSGVWAQDVVAIAESQVGYAESQLNYIVLEDGETMLGYTRYGEWYGIPYDNWDATFASFCLSYAGVEEIALSDNSAAWVDILSAEWQDLYRTAYEHFPVAGDLVFFDLDGDMIADRVGIVAEVIEATDFEPASILTVEGDCENQVQYMVYELTDSTILGYGMLPSQEEKEFLTFDYYDGIVEVSVELPADSDIPADAILSVTPIDEQNEKYLDLLTKADEVVHGGISEILFYDISFYTSELEYIPVDDSARVTMRLADSTIGAGSNTIVLHFDEETSDPVIISDVSVEEETVIAATTFSLRAETVETTETVVSFETDGFSDFAIVDVESLCMLDDPNGRHVDSYSAVGIGNVSLNTQDLVFSLDTLKQIVANGGSTFNIIYKPDEGSASLTPQAQFNAWAIKPVYYANGNIKYNEDGTEMSYECEIDMNVTDLGDGTYMATISLDRLLNLFTSGEFGTKTVDDITNLTIQAFGNKGMTVYKAWFDTEVAYEDLFDKEIVVFNNPSGQTMYRVTTNAAISDAEGYQYKLVASNISDTSAYGDTSTYLVIDNGNGTYTVYDKTQRQPIDSWEGFGEGKQGGTAYDTFADYSIEDIKDIIKLGNVTFNMTFGGNTSTYHGSDMTFYLNAWGDYNLIVPDDTLKSFGKMVDNGDGTRTVTISMDALLAKFTASGHSIDDIQNFIVQNWINDFVLYKAWFDTEPASDTFNYETQIVIHNNANGSSVNKSSFASERDAGIANSRGYLYAEQYTETVASGDAQSDTLAGYISNTNNYVVTQKTNDDSSITYTVYNKNSYQKISATDGFGEGTTSWSQYLDTFDGYDIEDIKHILNTYKGVTFNMTFEGTAWSDGGMNFLFNVWETPSQTKISIPEDGAVPYGYMVDNGDGTKTVTVNMDELINQLVAKGYSVNDITNFTIQSLHDNFEIRKAWFDTTDSFVPLTPSDEMFCAVETEVSTSLVNGDETTTRKLVTLPSAVAHGETVVLHIKGYTPVDTQIWLCNGAWTQKSAHISIPAGEFDEKIEVAVNQNEGTATATNIQFASGTAGNRTESLDDLNLTHIGIYEGTYDEFFNAAYKQTFLPVPAQLVILEDITTDTTNNWRTVLSGQGLGEGDFSYFSAGTFDSFSITLEQLVEYAKEGATLYYNFASPTTPTSYVQFNVHNADTDASYQVSVTPTQIGTVDSLKLSDSETLTNVPLYQCSVSLLDVYNQYINAGGVESDIDNFTVSATNSNTYPLVWYPESAWLIISVPNEDGLVTPPADDDDDDDTEMTEVIVFEGTNSYEVGKGFAIGPQIPYFDTAIPTINDMPISKLQEYAAIEGAELVIELSASTTPEFEIQYNIAADGSNDAPIDASIKDNGDGTYTATVKLADLLNAKSITASDITNLGVRVADDSTNLTVNKVSFAFPASDTPETNDPVEDSNVLIYRLETAIMDKTQTTTDGEGNETTTTVRVTSALSDGIAVEGWMAPLITEYFDNDSRYQLQLFKTALTVEGSQIKLTYKGDATPNIIVQSYENFAHVSIGATSITDADENGFKVATFDANALADAYSAAGLTFGEMLNFGVNGSGNTVYGFEIVAPAVPDRPVINLDGQIAAIIAVNNYVNPGAAYTSGMIYPAVSSAITGAGLVGSDMDSFTVDENGNATISDDDLTSYGAEGNRIVWEFEAVKDGEGNVIFGQYYIQSANYYGSEYDYPDNSNAGKYLNISSSGITLSDTPQAIEVVEHTPTGDGAIIEDNIVCFRVKEGDNYIYLQLGSNYGDNNIYASVAPHDTPHFLGNQFVIVDIVDEKVNELKEAIDKLPTTEEFFTYVESIDEKSGNNFEQLCAYRTEMRRLAQEAKALYDELVAAGGDVALQLNFVGYERVDKLLENLEWLWRADPEVVEGVTLNATVKLFDYDTSVNNYKLTAVGDAQSRDDLYFQFYNWESNSTDLPDGTRPPVGPAGWSATLNKALVDGYPQITAIGTRVDEQDVRVDVEPYSMGYLFDSTYQKAEMTDGGGLFQQDADGYYYYYSDTNAAWWNPETNRFELYDVIVRPKYDYQYSNHILYDEETDRYYYETSSGNRTYYDSLEAAIESRNEPLSNFLPFNEVIGSTMYDFPDESIDSDYYYFIDEVESSQTDDMMTNTVYLNEDVDLWFGMSIEFDFFVPEDAKVNGNDMIFDFHGDDDVFVYIDGVLVLDIGGCHEAFDGNINFATGDVYYQYNYGSTTTTLRAIFEAAEEQGIVEAGYVEKNFAGNTFKEFTNHHLNFFYMERGGTISYSGIRFNLPTVPEYSLMVSKELDAEINTNIDYTFRVNKVVANEVTEESLIPRGTQFSIFENWIDTGLTGKVNADGYFTLKAGQTAVFPQFTAEQLGTNDYVVREYLPTELASQYLVSYSTNSNVETFEFPRSVFHSDGGESFSSSSHDSYWGLTTSDFLGSYNMLRCLNIPLVNLRSLVEEGGQRLNIVFSGDKAGHPPMTAMFNAWSMPTYDENGDYVEFTGNTSNTWEYTTRTDKNGNTVNVVTAACGVEMTIATLSDGKYLASVNLDDIYELFMSSKFSSSIYGLNDVDDIVNFTIQLGHNNFVLYDAWFGDEYPHDRAVIVNDNGSTSYETDLLNLNYEQIVTYKNTAVEPTGDLMITKLEHDAGSFDSDKVFKMQVLVGDQSISRNREARAMLIPLPVGTKYTVYNGNTTTGEISGLLDVKYVDEPGIIKLAVGQTAQIHGILAGTYFEVTELIGEHDRFGATYACTYESTSRTWYDALGISGVYQYIGDSFHVTVTNTIKDYTFNVPLSKVVEGYSGNASFDFKVSYEISVFNEQTQQWETSEEANQTSITVTSADVTYGGVMIAFDANDLDEEGKLVLKLVEIAGEGNFIYDDSEYYIYIKVDDSNDTAYIDKICTYVKNLSGNLVYVDITSSLETYITPFVNYTLTDLTVQKTVRNLAGNDTSGTFPFEVLAYYPINELPEIQGVTCTWENAEEHLIKYMFSLSHEGSITIPVTPNTEVIVRETFNDGYSTYHKIGNGSEQSGSRVQFTIGNSDTTVEVINQIGYALPRTGGTGTKMYTTGGILLLAIFAILLYNKIICGKEERASS